MAVTSVPDRSVSPIVVPGQLTLRIIRGKNGPFPSVASPHILVCSRSRTLN